MTDTKTKFTKRDRVLIAVGKWKNHEGIVRGIKRDDNKHVLYTVAVEGAKPKINTYRSYNIY